MIPIIKIKYAVLLFLLPVFMVAQENRDAAIEALGLEYVANRKNHGLVIGFIEGDKTNIKGFGQLSKSNTNAPDANTLFEVGAVTNVFTANLMLIADQLGYIKMELPIQANLPAGVQAPVYQNVVCDVEVRVNDPIAGTSDQLRRVWSCKPDPLQPELNITFCDLATHTSGLPVAPRGLFSWNPFTIVRQMDDPYQDYSKADLYKRLPNYAFRSAPGAEYHYSNVGMALLGNVLEDATGRSYGELLGAYLIDPLQLKDTGLELTADEKKRLAPGHNRKGKAASSWHFEAMAPAAGLKSSAQDLLQFVRVNLETEETKLGLLFEQAQQSRVEVPTKKFDQLTYTGYGWLTTLLSETSNLPVVWINGGTGGYRAFIGFIKDTQTGVVVLSNSANSVDDLGFKMLDLLNPVAADKTVMEN